MRDTPPFGSSGLQKQPVQKAQLNMLFQKEMVWGPARDTRWELWEEAWAAFFAKENLLTDFQIYLVLQIFRRKLFSSTCGTKRVSCTPATGVRCAFDRLFTSSELQGEVHICNRDSWVLYGVREVVQVKQHTGPG